MNYFTVPEMMNFVSDLIDVVFPAYTAEKSSVIPSFDTENTPIKDSRSQTRDLTFCDTRVNVPTNVITDTVVAELDSICNLTDLVDSPIVSAYLKVLSHAYWFYSKWIDYRLTDEMKRSYIQETIETVTAGLREGSNLLVNIPTRGQRTGISLIKFIWVSIPRTEQVEKTMNGSRGTNIKMSNREPLSWENLLLQIFQIRVVHLQARTVTTNALEILLSSFHQVPILFTSVISNTGLTQKEG